MKTLIHFMIPLIDQSVNFTKHPMHGIKAWLFSSHNNLDPVSNKSQSLCYSSFFRTLKTQSLGSKQPDPKQLGPRLDCQGPNCPNNPETLSEQLNFENWCYICSSRLVFRIYIPLRWQVSIEWELAWMGSLVGLQPFVWTRDKGKSEEVQTYRGWKWYQGVSGDLQWNWNVQFWSL